jgi:hypothetical protein
MSYLNTVLEDEPLALWLCDNASSTVLPALVGGAATWSSISSVTFNKNGPLLSEPSSGIEITSETASIRATATVSNLPSGAAPRTLECWFLPKAQGALSGGVIGGWPTGAYSPGDKNWFQIVYSPAGDQKFGVDLNTTKIFTSQSFPPSGHYYHLVATYDGSMLKFYVNGELEFSTVITLTTQVNPSGANFTVYGPTDPAAQQRRGIISRVAVYAKALSADRVKAHYEAGQVPFVIDDARALAGVGGTVDWSFVYYRSDHSLARLADITNFVISASIDCSIDRVIKRHLSLKLSSDAPLAEVGDHVLVFARVTDAFGTVHEFPCGLYHLDFPKFVETPALSTWEVDAYDTMIHLVMNERTAPYVAYANTDIITAAKQVAQLAGITDFNFPDVSATLASDMVWPVGTSYAKILSELLGAGNFYSPWFDNSNKLTTRLYDDFDTRPADVAYATDEESMVLPTFERSINSDRFANQVIIVSDDPQNPITAVAVNDSPSSPLSTINLGYTKSKTIVAPVATQSDADYRARVELQRSTALYKKARLLTTPDPRRVPHEIYDVSIYRNSAFEYQDLVLQEPGLIAYWRLGEKVGSFVDRSSSGNTAELAGASALRGVSGAVVEDDGAVMLLAPDTRVECTSPKNMNGAQGALEVWFRVEQFDVPHEVASVGYNGSTGVYSIGANLVNIRISVDTSGILTYRLQESTDGTANGVTITKSGSVTAKMWHHFVLYWRLASGAAGRVQFEALLDAVPFGTISQLPSSAWRVQQNVPLRLGPAGNARGLTVDEFAYYAASFSTTKSFLMHYEVGRQGRGEVASGKWWALAWTLPLAPGATMQHDIARVESFVG